MSKRYDLSQQETSTTMLTLSKGFASVEQYDDEGTQNFSPCPDIYSLGATMYNLLTGKIPTESILRATKPLQKPSEIIPSISATTEEVIIKSMEIIPADRFQSVSEMIIALGTPPIKEKKTIIKEGDGAFSEKDITEIYSKIQKTENSHTISENTNTIQPENEKPSKESDDDITIIKKTVVSNKQPVVSPKKKLLIPVLVSLILFTGVGVGLVIFNLKSEQNLIGKDGDYIINEKKIDSVAPSKLTDDTLAVSRNTLLESNKLPVSEFNKPKPKEQLLENIPEANQATQALPATNYADLLDSGRKKLAGGDYIGARDEFTKAKEILLTEEILRLLIACDNKEEESEVLARKASYEEKMTFGECIIVRNKATGRYGAIDEKGIECIPCKYLSVGKSEKGRAFEREDNLFDIYNSACELVSKGVTYY